MKKIIKNSKLFEVIFLFLISLTPLLWLKHGELILGHDSGFRLNPLRYLGDLFYSWDPSYNFGLDWSLFKGFLITQGPEALFTALTKSVFVGQLLTFILWFFIMGLSMYVFINAFFSEKKYWIFRIFSSAFYMYNFFLLQAWFIVERAKFSAYAALPLGLLVLYKALTKEYSLRKGLLLFIPIFFFLNGGGSPTFYGSFLIVYAVTFLYLTMINIGKSGYKELLYSLKVIMLFALSFLLSNAYWLLPQFYLFITNYNSALLTSGGIQGILGWEESISRNASFLNLFRLEGIPDWYNNINHQYAANYISNPLLIILSSLPLFIILFSLFKSKHKLLDGTKLRLFYLFSFLFLLGFIFTAGTHPPLGFIYTTFLKIIPGFTIFRSSFYKFGAVSWFSYIFLIGLCLNLILLVLYKRRFFYIFFGIIAILFVLFYHYPFFNSSFFIWNSPFSTKVKVPDYVYQIADYINRTPSSSRILLLPELDYQFNADAYTWGFWSLDSLPRLFTNRSIVANTGSSPAIISSIYAAIDRGDSETFLRLTGAIGVDRILWRDDILFSDKKTDITSFSYIKKELENLNGVKFEKKIGFWTLYRVESSYYLPLFYIPDKLAYSHSNHSFIEKALDKDVKKTVLFADDLVNKNREILSLSSGNLIEADCILCEVDSFNKMEDEVKIPYVKLLPDSPFYFLVSLREQKITSKYKNYPPQRIDADLSFATKRLAEINRIANRDFKTDNSEYLMEETIKKYKSLISDALSQSIKLPEEVKNPILIRILVYLEAHYRYFGLMNNKYHLAGDDLNTLSVFMRRSMDSLINKEIWMTDFPYDKIKYTFTIEKSGNYDLHIESKGVEPKKILIDNEGITNSTNYLSSGFHRLNLIYPTPENTLVTYTATDSGELVLDFDKNVRFGIKSYQDKDTYIVNFDYRIVSGRPDLSVVEGNKDGKNIISYLKLKENTIWNNFRYLLKPTHGATQAYLQFAPSEFYLENAVIDIKNFTIIRNFFPEVFLFNSFPSSLGQAPNIAFKKNNPTSYTLHIKDATSPYILNFGEAFDSGWKAYIIKSDKASPLSTFFMTPIDKKNHYELDGYANGWFIDKKGNYDILVEYFPQKVFYIGLVISAATLLSFVILILVRRNK